MFHRRGLFSLFSILFCAGMCLPASAAETPKVASLFASYRVTGTTGVFLQWSDDRLTWHNFGKDEPILKSTLGDKVSRDPSVIQGPDGEFHMVFTIATLGQSIGYAHSKDLIHWSEQMELPVMKDFTDTRNCGGPEIRYDEKNKRYFVYWYSALKNNTARGSNYYMTTPDFKTFSKTEVLADPGYNSSTIIKGPDGKYLLFSQNGGFVISGSENLQGPFTGLGGKVADANWSGATVIWTGSDYLLYARANNARPPQTGVWQSSDLATWANVTSQSNFAVSTMQGSVFDVSPEFLGKLKIALGEDPAAPKPAPIAKLQTSIKYTYVYVSNGQRIGGGAGDLILTATRGTVKGPTPVTFTSKVGPGMTAVLDDVLRAVRVKNPLWEASKIEIGFDERNSPKDGGSVGAALGTLMLSMLQGFDIDPKLAITGDVSADGKVRAIGGVSHKIKGAGIAGCTIFALPKENYDQLVDAFVFEGQPLITNMHVVGIGNLEEAAAVARKDRDAKLTEANEAFDAFQAAQKKSPAYLRTKEGQAALAHILELNPDDYSAKLLQQVAQNKQPRKLSARASMYYTFAAVDNVMPILVDAEKFSSAPATIFQEGQRNLLKVKEIADPKIVPLVDALRDFVAAFGSFQARRITLQALQLKAKAVDNAMEKINTNHELVEKMLHEGI